MRPTPTPLVLLPGLICDARMWAPQVAALADVAEASVGDLSVAGSMAGLAAAVLASAPERFALAGLSMGGYVALEIMRTAPHRVLGLALLDTSARPDTPEATENRRAAMARAEHDFAGVIEGLIPKLLHPAHQGDVAIVQLLTTMGVDAGTDVFRRQQSAIIGRADSRPSLGEIRCPTLVLCGREDSLTPPELHEEMASGIPGATLRIVDECGHMSTLSRPAEVSAALRDWLGTLAAT